MLSAKLYTWLVKIEECGFEIEQFNKHPCGELHFLIHPVSDLTVRWSFILSPENKVFNIINHTPTKCATVEDIKSLYRLFTCFTEESTHNPIKIVQELHSKLCVGPGTVLDIKED